VALVTLILLALAWRPALDPIDPPAAGLFDPSLIRRGAELAALGDCATCHTARERPTFAGGRAIPTPFGTIYSTNITPDPTTGIGRWSQGAFARAMREGVDRQGRHLFPAFPYDHFTLINDEDIAALYAFFMTRPPVQARAPSNDIAFPLRFRPLLAGWKLLFLHKGRYREDDRHDAAWNRGAYLAEGVGHCGACHTPRNVLGAEKPDQHFGGGDAEGWHAYALDSASRPGTRWDVDAMELYLRNGWQTSHGVAQGPMAAVTDGMTAVADGDLRAMATYVVAEMTGAVVANSNPGSTAAAPSGVTNTISGSTAAAPSGVTNTISRSTAAAASGITNSDGARIYAAACAGCHESHQPLPFGAIDLSLSTDVSGEDPTNLIHVVLDGLQPADETRQPVMPGFRKALSEPQLVSLLTYLRGRFARRSLWPGTDSIVRRNIR
jgi:mono/diheme cytochrome c family protein